MGISEKKGNQVHVASSELLLAGGQLTADADPSFVLGQSVLICDGVLKGATGTLVSAHSPGHYLISLSEQGGKIWASMPVRLLRAN